MWFKEGLRLSKISWEPVPAARQGIQDSLSYTLGQNQSSGIWIFTDSQTALQALENPKGMLRTADYADNHAVHRWPKNLGYPSPPPLDICSYSC